jgi:hypothetical protein
MFVRTNPMRRNRQWQTESFARPRHDSSGSEGVRQPASQAALDSPIRLASLGLIRVKKDNRESKEPHEAPYRLAQM